MTHSTQQGKVMEIIHALSRMTKPGRDPNDDAETLTDLIKAAKDALGMDLTILTPCDECGEGYDEEKGDGYCGKCPSCADAEVLV